MNDKKDKFLATLMKIVFIGGIPLGIIIGMYSNEILGMSIASISFFFPLIIHWLKGGD